MGKGGQWMLPWLAAGAICLASATGARAQEVRPADTGFGSTRRQGDAAAEKQERADWPRVGDGETGTQAHLTFDFNNADIVLITNREFGLPPLLNEARHIAAALQRPQADFITFVGTKTTVTTDIELNDYIQRRGKQHRTDFDLDFGTLVKALKTSALPRPIVLLVRGDEADLVTLTLSEKEAPRRLEEKTFFALDAVPPGARLHFTATIRWYAYPAAAAFVGLMLFAVVSTALMPWKLAKMRAKRQAEPEAPPDPAEVQKQYTRQWPLSLLVSLMPLLFIGLSFLGNPQRLMQDIFTVLPLSSLPPSMMLLLPVGMIGLTGISALACFVTERIRGRGNLAPASTEPSDPDAAPSWTEMGWLWPLAAGMVLMPLLLFLPALRQLESHWRVAVVFGIEALVFVSAAVVALRGSRANRTTLTPDSSWHRLVQEVAAQAGVRVRHVVQVRSPLLNAYASIFGTVGLTSALLRKMEPEEVGAIVAHEIGHLKHRHPQRAFCISLIALALFFAFFFGVIRPLKGRIPDYTYALLTSPLPGMVLGSFLFPLLAGRGQRRREQAADQFAVEATGDPELVIRTLTKLHTLNASPHQLKPGDEIISSHPSLVHRIESIRRYAGKATSS